MADEGNEEQKEAVHTPEAPEKSAEPEVGAVEAKSALEVDNLLQTSPATHDSTTTEDAAELASILPSEIAEVTATMNLEPATPIELKDEEPVKAVHPESRPLPSPRPLSQRFMSPPTHTRSRSNSPGGRFPVKIDEAASTSRDISPAPQSGRNSPAKRLSTDMQSINLSSAVATADTSPLPSPPATETPGGMFRKASSGFGGLLGRMGSIRKTALSPPARGKTDRRESSNSNTTMIDKAALAAITDEDARPSLQDRFKHLREQEEHHDLDTLEGGEGGTSSRQSLSREEDDIMPLEPSNVEHHSGGRTKRTSSNLSQSKVPQVSTDLPPGTASGMSAGPARQQIPVNWDLWQAVVYEGPAAVARTSGEELSRAIASGIPAAIRGVVWQVLAESKSEELEHLYKTLKTRGSEAEVKPTLPQKDAEAPAPPVPEKDETTSSRSSVHSATSSDHAASSVTTPPASVEGNSTELQNKLFVERQKRESLALQKLEKAIKRDLGSRTSYSKYTQSAGLQDGLFGVCKAYALFDTHVGYAQGINFIAMPLLFNMPEEEAFTLLVRMMHHFQLRTLFEPEMPGLHLRLYQFERILEDLEPALFCHLKRRHVSPELYATQWFLTLFAYRFPLQLVLRVYDLMFSEGLTAIMKFGIVLMQKNKEALLDMKDMSHLTTFLKEKLFDVYIDKSPSASSLLDSGFFGSVTGGADKELYRADELVQDATQVIIAPETLSTYETEWEEQRRTEKERESELDNLRTSNGTLSSKVRTLEERVQQHDAEHVGIASDLVKYKVENDTLQDAKEALEMQVSELQKLLDTQPAEIEEKLKAEMDRIMQRNMEVQNENRHLQDELENAEQQLVRMSMTHAETQADFDTLKQKWSGLQAMMNGK